MQGTLFQCFVRLALAAVCLSAMANAATAGSFTRGCAARDLEILMMIEEREATETVSSEKLNDAMLTMMHARIVCHEGHVMEALTIYDDIARSIASDWVLPDRSQFP